MVRSARSRRRILALPFVASATLLFGTGTGQAVMLARGGPDVVAPEPDRDLDGVNRAAYLSLAPATVIESATTDDDPPFLCRRVPADAGDD